MKKFCKNDSGITLIALIVTIIVCLILASITISSFVNTGIINKTKNAKNKWEDSDKNVELELERIREELQGEDLEFRIRFVDGETVLQHNCKVMFYKDSDCQVLVKKFEITEKCEDLNYTYIGENLVPVGIYWVKVDIAPPGYSIPNECKVEIKNKVNIITIDFNKLSAMPSTGGGISSWGDVVDDTIDVTLELDTHFDHWEGGTIETDLKYLVEPLAEYNKNNENYEWRSELSQNSMNIIKNVMNATMTGIYIDEGIDKQYVGYWGGLFYFNDYTGVDNSSDGIEADLNLNDDNDWAYSVKGNVHDEPLIIRGLSRNTIYIVKPLTVYYEDQIFYHPPMVIVPRMYRDIDGNWRDTIHVMFAHECIQAESELNIISNIQNTYISEEPVTFVYNVTSELNGKQVYSNIVAANIENNENTNSRSVIIPSGTNTTVTLLYSSLGFENIVENEKTIAISGNQSVTFEYENVSETLAKTASVDVSNLYYNGGDGTWNLESNSYNNGKIAINSDFSNWAKHIYIDANIDNDTPYFIRVKAFAPLDVSFSDSEGVWRNGDDGYCYYSGILSGGDASSELNAQLQIPEYFEETCEEFDFVTIVEAVPVMYDENGNPYADWNATVGSNEGGA